MAGPLKGLLSLLFDEAEKTKQPLKERATVLPLGQYEDGSVGLAWPGMLADPVQRGYQAANTPIPAINDDEAWREKSAAMFDVTSLAPLGAGLAGGIVDNAVGSAGGNLAKGSRAALSANDADYLRSITDFARSSGDGDVIGAIEWDRGRGYFNPPDDWEAVLAAAQGGVDAPTVAPQPVSKAVPQPQPTAQPVQQSLPMATSAGPQGIRAYHGSGFNVPIDTIPMYGTEKPFLWATDSPSLASEYADAGANFGSDYYWNNIKNRYGRDKPEQSAMVYPVEMRFNNPYELDAGGALAAEIPWGKYFTNTEEIAGSLADMGHDGVIIKNVRDYVSDPNMEPGTVYGALKRGTVYSGTTGDLLFGNAPTGSIPGLAAQTQEQDPQTLTTANILKFLRGQK